MGGMLSKIFQIHKLKLNGDSPCNMRSNVITFVTQSVTMTVLK